MQGRVHARYNARCCACLHNASQCHAALPSDTLTRLVRAQCNGPRGSQSIRWPFILYGDSLTEIWKGTRGCQPYSVRKGFDAIRQKYLSPLSNADGMSGAGICCH